MEPYLQVTVKANYRNHTIKMHDKGSDLKKACLCACLPEGNQTLSVTEKLKLSKQCL